MLKLLPKSKIHKTQDFQPKVMNPRIEDKCLQAIFMTMELDIKTLVIGNGGIYDS